MLIQAFISCLPQKGTSSTEPFLPYQESENSFHIHLNNIISLSFFFFCAQMYSIPSCKDIIIYLTTLSWKDTCTIILKTVVVENMCIYQEVESLGQL